MNKKKFKIDNLQVEAYPVDTWLVIAGSLRKICSVFVNNAGEVYYLVRCDEFVFLSAQEVDKLVFHDISKMEVA